MHSLNLLVGQKLRAGRSGLFLVMGHKPTKQPGRKTADCLCRMCATRSVFTTAFRSTCWNWRYIPLGYAMREIHAGTESSGLASCGIFSGRRGSGGNVLPTYAIEFAYNGLAVYGKRPMSPAMERIPMNALEDPDNNFNDNVTRFGPRFGVAYFEVAVRRDDFRHYRKAMVTLAE
jgi:hypothetical protein